MACRMDARSPRPLARATTMPPPVAREVNRRETMPLMVPTMETAAMAASPTEETMAEESMLIRKMKNWSSASVRNIFTS